MTTLLTLSQLKQIGGEGINEENARSVLDGLRVAGAKAGLNRPHRLAHYLCQVAHESGRFKYDKEVWGPTKAQKRYEDRKDLGHSPEVDNEAFTFRGRSGMQLTGRHNYQRFTKWAKTLDHEAPDFEAQPDLVNTDPWEGLVGIWYWDVGNPTGKSLNQYADTNNIEMITRRINGGLNGFDDRLELYTRVGLVLLGYDMGTGVIKRFQMDHGLTPDDISGPKTREAIHKALVKHGEEVPEVRPAAPTQIPEPRPTPIVGEHGSHRYTADEVRNVQQLLRDKGYPEVGHVDGKYGDRTANAINSFRRDHGLPENGEIDDALLANLVRAGKRQQDPIRATATAKQLRPGSETLQGSNALKKVGKWLIPGALAAGTVDEATDPISTLSNVDVPATLERLNMVSRLWRGVYTFVTDNIFLIIILAGVAAYIWYRAQKNEDADVEAHREGKHV